MSCHLRQNLCHDKVLFMPNKHWQMSGAIGNGTLGSFVFFVRHFDNNISRFEKLVTYQKENGEYRVDFARFNSTFAVPDTPLCSAKELDELVVCDSFQC